MLITTDLLQEGEDLHTFCSRIYHYGISWTPSAMEQRIGRIDRVRSQTDRRLSVLQHVRSSDEKLQVYFPHLQDTVEVLQVRRVLDRMDEFLRLMHEGLVLAGKEERRIDTVKEFGRTYRPSVAGTHPLVSSFPIRKEHLRGTECDVAPVMKEVDRLSERFQASRLRGFERTTPDGERYVAHLFKDGRYRVADPALGRKKHHAENQLAVTLEEISGYLSKGYHLRMHGELSMQVNLISATQVKPIY